jgi:tagaturonate epimerase
MQNDLYSLKSLKDRSSEPKRFSMFPDFVVDVYPSSIHRHGNADFFIGRRNGKKTLFGVAPDPEPVLQSFTPLETISRNNGGPRTIIVCPLDHHNAAAIRSLFAHTQPQLLGIGDSFGLGDRIGLANPGHIQAVRDSGFQPVLAQQSIRELTRTNRTPEEVLDAASWAVFQEGYRDGFGADADHLKTTDDVDLMIGAGFTMFTIDPSEYVVNEAGRLTEDELRKRALSIAWNEIDDSVEAFVDRYRHRSFPIDGTFVLAPSAREILQAAVKYGNVIAHVRRMYSHIKTRYPGRPSEVEVSVDETDSPTTLFEHYCIANELKRLGVELVSLAPRFIGDFEKGVDYRGDIGAFTEEYKKHIAIAEKLGPYKLSIHSGSDKFSVYQAIGNVGRGHVHVKTAGTSYLEALRVVAAREPDLFRSILRFSLAHFEVEKQTYHVSGDLRRVPDPGMLDDDNLMELFENDDARQVLHVAFGKVLTDADAGGAYTFKLNIIACLDENENLHYRYVKEHFRRHIDPFGKNVRSAATA